MPTLDVIGISSLPDFANNAVRKLYRELEYTHNKTQQLASGILDETQRENQMRSYMQNLRKEASSIEDTNQEKTKREFERETYRVSIQRSIDTTKQRSIELKRSEERMEEQIVLIYKSINEKSLTLNRLEEILLGYEDEFVVLKNKLGTIDSTETELKSRTKEDQELYKNLLHKFSIIQTEIIQHENQLSTSIEEARKRRNESNMALNLLKDDNSTKCDLEYRFLKSTNERSALDSRINSASMHLIRMNKLKRDLESKIKFGKLELAETLVSLTRNKNLLNDSRCNLKLKKDTLARISDGQNELQLATSDFDALCSETSKSQTSLDQITLENELIRSRFSEQTHDFRVSSEREQFLRGRKSSGQEMERELLQTLSEETEICSSFIQDSEKLSNAHQKIADSNSQGMMSESDSHANLRLLESTMEIEGNAFSKLRDKEDNLAQKEYILMSKQFSLSNKLARLSRSRNPTENEVLVERIRDLRRLAESFRSEVDALKTSAKRLHLSLVHHAKALETHSKKSDALAEIGRSLTLTNKNLGLADTNRMEVVRTMRLRRDLVQIEIESARNHLDRIVLEAASACKKRNSVDDELFLRLISAEEEVATSRADSKMWTEKKRFLSIDLHLSTKKRLDAQVSLEYLSKKKQAELTEIINTNDISSSNRTSSTKTIVGCTTRTKNTYTPAVIDSTNEAMYVIECAQQKETLRRELSELRRSITDVSRQIQTIENANETMNRMPAKTNNLNEVNGNSTSNSMGSISKDVCALINTKLFCSHGTHIRTMINGRLQSIQKSVTRVYTDVTSKGS